MTLKFDQIGTGRPVILLHAFPLSKKMWKDQAELLSSNGFHVILPDLPGFGEDRLNSERFSIEEMAQQVLELINSLKIDKAIIGGLSMGGYVLFNLFRLAPEKFSALILCDTTHQADTAEKRKGRFELISKIEETGSKALVENMLPNLIADESKEKNSALVAMLEAEFSSVNPVSAKNALLSMAERKDSTDIIGVINVPTLLVFGEFDKITNLENASNMNESIPRAELRIIKRAGHYSNLEQPAEFNKILLSFCRQVNFNA
jgi:3-oxoadipate enol-lactonase